MSIDALRDMIPAYAKDLSRPPAPEAPSPARPPLTDQQKWGAFVACAYAVGVPRSGAKH